MPMQMVAAAIFAAKLRANFPLSMALVWFSNPLTMPPIFYFEYLVGTWVLGMHSLPFEYELSFAWFRAQLYDIGLPLLVGSVLCGIVLSSAGYLTINLIWRHNVQQRWKARQALRLGKKTEERDSEG